MTFRTDTMYENLAVYVYKFSHTVLNPESDFDDKDLIF
jgi:hypothetical protein